MPRHINRRSDFVRWLKHQPPSRKFGVTCDDCPLHSYSGSFVSYSKYRLPNTFVSHPLPSWAVQFVTALFKYRVVTAQGALRIMEQI